MNQIEKLLENIEKIVPYDGVFATEAGYSFAKKNNSIGLRIDIGFLENRPDYGKVLAIDFDSNLEEITLSVIFNKRGEIMKELNEEEILSFSRLFNASIEKMLYEKKEVVDIKSILKRGMEVRIPLSYLQKNRVNCYMLINNREGIFI